MQALLVLLCAVKAFAAAVLVRRLDRTGTHHNGIDALAARACLDHAGCHSGTVGGPIRIAVAIGLAIEPWPWRHDRRYRLRPRRGRPGHGQSGSGRSGDRLFDADVRHGPPVHRHESFAKGHVAPAQQRAFRSRGTARIRWPIVTSIGFCIWLASVDRTAHARCAPAIARSSRNPCRRCPRQDSRTASLVRG